MTNQNEYIETQPNVSTYRMTPAQKQVLASGDSKEKAWNQQQVNERNAWQTLRRLSDYTPARLKNSKQKRDHTFVPIY